MPKKEKKGKKEKSDKDATIAVVQKAETAVSAKPEKKKKKEKSAKDATLVVIPKEETKLTGLTPEVENYISKVVETVKKTDKAIKKGLDKPTASTGTSMSDLYGAAHSQASISNIGEGSTKTGGGGTKKGYATLLDNAEAKGEIKMAYKIAKSQISQENIVKIDSKIKHE